jgi:SecD/SecF fusion protein
MQRKFLRPALICVIPCLIAVAFIWWAYVKYEAGEGGFNFGVDLAGGTILIYEIDKERDEQLKKLQGDVSKKTDIGALAEALKRRIDPADLLNVTVRAVGESRVEIILPFSGSRTAGKQVANTARVDEIKRLIEKVGRLEFEIVANSVDDKKAFEIAKEYFKNTTPEELDSFARKGVPPPFPTGEKPLISTHKGESEREATYQWVEIGLNARKDLDLQNKFENSGGNGPWQWLAKAREEHIPYEATYSKDEHGQWINQGNGPKFLIYSRKCLAPNLTPSREDRKYEYFMLMRASDNIVVDGKNITITANPDIDQKSFRPDIEFTFNTEGGRRFFQITSLNIPENGITRHLAIILDGELISYPAIKSAISNHGQITGNFDQAYVNQIVRLLRAGALPATLKRTPVSENTTSPTLGKDAIRNGQFAIIAAFVAILLFMLIYYQFAGFVACVALLANLILTVGIMVMLNAAWTLPGLAGLVLMLGMAVDANVLIYERLREERERGANLMMAIRHAYDRAFPTIIDTHLSSIFTAIVLYAVGNDQLKGFGVSLTVGLIISLFTSLFMTRLIFDYGLYRKLFSKLNMLKLLTKPNLDFMKIRHIMFATTGILTVLGLGLFLARGKAGLNVDFIGGVVYGGTTKEAMDITEMRSLMREDRQKELLKVNSVEKVPEEGSALDIWKINYANGDSIRVQLANEPEGATLSEKEANFKKRAEELPDWSVEQNFARDETGDKSRRFTIRTTEKEPELVKVAINRLFTKDGQSLLVKSTFNFEKQNKEWLLKFVDSVQGQPTYASPSYIKLLLDREFRTALPSEEPLLEPFRLDGVDDPKDGRHAEMLLTLTSEAEDYFKSNPSKKRDEVVTSILKKVQTNYNSLPQPDRLETFDATLAGEMQSRAFFAIAASWLAILLYLWFRFGNWTFGAAAVVCLIHDLCFTLGAIAICHYLHDTSFGKFFGLQDFKIDLPAVAALLTLVGYSVNDTIVVFDRIREVRGKNPALTPQIINDSVNQTLSRTILTSLATWLVVVVLYFFGGEGVHLFAYVMVVGVIVGTYSSIYVASPLLLIFGEGHEHSTAVTALGTPPASKPEVPATS